MSAAVEEFVQPAPGFSSADIDRPASRKTFDMPTADAAMTSQAQENPRRGKRDDVPEPIRRVLGPIRHVFRMATASGRALPSVVLAGVQKGGTTSLYHQLRVHPNVAWCRGKGTHYFDLGYGHSFTWYRSQFPHRRTMARQERRAGGAVITAESCGYYFDHPAAAGRCAETLPDTRVIIMLRNPIKRAYSHYYDSVRKGYEPLSFEEALEQESERTEGEAQKLLADPGYYSVAHRQLTYLSRGVYIDHVRRWMEAFPRDRVLVLPSEAFYADMPTEYQRVLDFLGLPSWTPRVFEKHNAASYAPLAPETRAKLAAYYEPHNRRLYEYLGTDFGWS